MKLLLPVLLCSLIFNGLKAQKIESFPENDPKLSFAKNEIKPHLGKYQVQLIADASLVRKVCADNQLPAPKWDADQCYAIRRKGSQVWVLSSNALGAMYGGLDVAEALRVNHPGWLNASDQKPYLPERGLKFNIPLDLRTPSYTDASDAAQANIPEVWKEEFWQEYFDEMARHRMNVMTLWSLHPFPSLVYIPEFPEVGLNDVWRTKAKYDDTFSHNADGWDRPYLYEDVEVVKKISIQEKMDFWRKVMQMADDRGIRFYIFTWNKFTYGAEGKHGITDDQTNDTTIAYFRAAVRELVKQYPLLKGIGITAGEHMDNKLTNDYRKEKWLWRTYGEGINDGLKAAPREDFRLIHRFHQTGLADILESFKGLECRLDLSIKYAIAHMYSIPNPPFTLPAFDLLTDENKSWLTIRNDDVYSMRWANVDFARQFIGAIPNVDKIAGYYMGPDGYTWGRDFLNKNTLKDPPLVFKKQWVSNMIWGRLSFDPTLPREVFDENIREKFGSSHTTALMKAWEPASMIFPFITRFVWGDIDLKWFPEANFSHRKYRSFYTVDEYIKRQPMDGSAIAGIDQWLHDPKAAETLRSPLSVADSLEKLAQTALTHLKKLPAFSSTDQSELSQTSSDIEAFAEVGLYYANKIRAAYSLARYDKLSHTADQQQSLDFLKRAEGHWNNYATIYSAKNQPALYNRVGWVDVNALKEEVKKDYGIVKNWKPGSITYKQQVTTEKPFKK
ncbi:hypothetical protein [Persicitalea jodogahamensis]|uniref:Carbohydrate-binding family 6 protein n=1 Tax=Persicitalea jodogahamensis TaxID=402147 RepID=A0A8J3D322_9BACT|nr:hypothetical protein [Persicitalea jodogahamensis]GHB62469.1 hypothetical protein GCM10007390_15360 [Persicitalea jodogahamensis]